MPRWKRWITERLPAHRSSEQGSASLEFITAGLILLVPLVYLILTIASIQAAALASEGAARQAARVFVQSDTEAEGEARARRAVQFALTDYGLDPDAATISITCSPSPDSCLSRRGLVTVTVALSVPLPGMPPVITAAIPAEVPLSATASEQVSRFWSGP